MSDPPSARSTVVPVSTDERSELVGEKDGSGAYQPPARSELGHALGLVFKQCFDIVGATLLVIFLMPLLLLIAVVIRLDSVGPAIYVQERVGARWRYRNGHVRWEIRPFRLYKFRSMFTDVDDSLHRTHIAAFVKGQPADNARPGAAFKLAHDPRVTALGAVLRRTSLDELPQLFNVLKGEMSLVGPRPVPEYEVEGYSESDWERLRARPGITGLWQVNGRADVSFAEMIELDIEYVRRRTLALDLKILARTLPAVLEGRGAG